MTARSFRTPAALRAGLEARLVAEAESRAVEVDRVRRQVAFERLLVRLRGRPGADGRWVLKGGFALELRLRTGFRTTRDLDLASLHGADSGIEVHEQLGEALADDVEQDHFGFAVMTPSTLAADRAGRPGWRFPVDISLAGRTFVKVRMDVVARADEIEGGVEQLTFPSGLAFAGYPSPVTVPAVDLAQHAAEKFHALTRPYGEQTNTRVKDLVDLVLLAENGLIDPARLAPRLQTVFAVRATHDLPHDLPEPPAAWDRDYASLITDIHLETQTVQAAIILIKTIWKACAFDAARD
jgi:nucleotidyltransferase AbiEii toxin of type IV toxin-antitoxin system